MRKLLSIILIVIVLGTSVLGCNKDTTTDDKKYKVAVITDCGDITDRSYNQTTYEACRDFCQKNDMQYNYFIPMINSPAERIMMIDTAVSEGYNIIILPGYAFAESIVKTAPSYQNVIFIAFDISENDLLREAVGEGYDENPDNWELSDYINNNNLFSAVFKEELSGYMAGYAAVKLGYEDLGFLGGMAVPSVIRYGYGFVQGAEQAARELEQKVNIKYAYAGQFYGDADITAVMDTWFANDTQIVFAAAGDAYSSVAEAARKSGCKIIGVDVDQCETIDESYGQGITVTSATKGLYTAAYTVLDDIVNEGKWSEYSGRINSLGIVSNNPEENFVQLPINSTQFNDNFTKEDYKKLVEKMLSGEYKVSEDVTSMPQTDYVMVIDYGSIK